MILICRCRTLQWILEKAQDNAEWWLIKSAGSGKYINLEGGSAGNGVALIAGDERFAWDIKPDPEHGDKLRYDLLKAVLHHGLTNLSYYAHEDSSSLTPISISILRTMAAT